jgi:hypothetical protein
MKNWIGVIIGVVALIAAIVVVINDHSQTTSVRAELTQLEQQQSQLQAAERTAKSASTARLGICWQSTQDSSTFDISQITIDSPVESGGVYSCPSGQTFVSVVPGS